MVSLRYRRIGAQAIAQVIQFRHSIIALAFRPEGLTSSIIMKVMSVLLTRKTFTAADVAKTAVNS